MNASAIDAENLISYCSSLADEFEARLNRIRHFIKNHNLTSGTANEAILRDFLSQISAGVYEVAQGFVCNPIRSVVSKQCDILVHDRRFPLVHSEGEVKIVWPDAALMVIEVKTVMEDTKTLTSAIENIVAAKQTEGAGIGNKLINGLIFAFEALTGKSALKVLNSYPGDPLNRPMAVFLFDQGVIIQQEDISRHWNRGSGASAYELRKCEGNKPSALVLTYFFLLFIRLQTAFAPREFKTLKDLNSTIKRFLEEYTYVVG